MIPVAIATTADGIRFLNQNEEFAEDLTIGDVAVIDAFAEHHCGGLIVLGRYIDENWYVKAHENWGDLDDGALVVHTYNLDEDRVEDPDAQRVEYFKSGHEAVAAFLAATPIKKEES